MKRTMLILLAVLIGLIPSSLRAQAPPPIAISLSFTDESGNPKEYYGAGEAVPATITITNNGSAIYLNSDFLTRNYYLELRIVDPAGQVVPAVRPEDEPDHDMQPLPFRYDATTGKVYEVGPCSEMASGDVGVPALVDLRQYYDLSLPGRYLAQVHLSAMQFADSTCDMGAYLWQGLLESNVATFYMAGDTQVSVSPNVWPLTWKSASPGTTAVMATLTPPTGVDVNQLETRAVYLNDVYGEGGVNGSSLVVTFDGRQAIDSLGTVERGKTYKVRVAGWYRGGGYFGGLAEIKILEYLFQGFFSPVDNPPFVNTAKAGQAVPVKWRLTDATGHPVSDPTSFVSLTSSPVSCSDFTGTPESAIETYAGASGLQYLGDGNWQYNWKTPTPYANTCRTMVLYLKDGSSHTANFKFRK